MNDGNHLLGQLVGISCVIRGYTKQSSGNEIHKMNIGLCIRHRHTHTQKFAASHEAYA